GTPFTTVLHGHPPLAAKMKLGILAALDQRISVRHHMAGMKPKETADYIRHHLAQAGRSDTLFTDDAIALIHTTSRENHAASTTSPWPRSSQPAPRARPSSRKPAPGPPSPRPQPTTRPRHRDHHSDNLTTTAPPEPTRAGLSTSKTASPRTTRPCARSLARNSLVA